MNYDMFLGKEVLFRLNGYKDSWERGKLTHINKRLMNNTYKSTTFVLRDKGGTRRVSNEVKEIPQCRKVRFQVELELDDDYHIISTNIESEKLTKAWTEYIEWLSSTNSIDMKAKRDKWLATEDGEVYTVKLNNADETTTLATIAEALKIAEGEKK